MNNAVLAASRRLQRSKAPGPDAKESQISSAPTGTNSVLVTIAAITTICGRERNTRRMLE